MDHFWSEIKGKSLLSLTLPGSHNSGNTPDLGEGPRCTSDYRYEEYSRSIAPAAPLPEKVFDERFIPWNVNHNHTVSQQLLHGIRFFHLKLCIFGSGDGAGLDLSRVRHQHRGYTPKGTILQMVDDVISFLRNHPKEVVVLGFNNLHAADSPHAFNNEVAALAISLVAEFRKGGLNTLEGIDLKKPLQELVEMNKRIAIFIPVANYVAVPEGVIRSQEWFYEPWDSVMASGNLNDARKWLQQDLRNFVESKFHVLQANPNNAEDAMYKLLQDDDRPSSLQEWIAPFLSQLGGLILSSLGHRQLGQTPQSVINAISTDFLVTSRPFEIAMRLMGLAGPEGDCEGQSCLSV